MRKRRPPTRIEIKQQICDHTRMDQRGLSEQTAAAGPWRTRLSCPTCAWTFVRETPEAVGTPVAHP